MTPATLALAAKLAAARERQYHTLAAPALLLVGNRLAFREAIRAAFSAGARKGDGRPWPKRPTWTRREWGCCWRRRSGRTREGRDLVLANVCPEIGEFLRLTRLDEVFAPLEEAV